MSLNHAEWCVLVSWRVGDNHSYELYAIPRDGSDAPSIEPARGQATSAVWVARNRFAALEKNNQVSQLTHNTGQITQHKSNELARFKLALITQQYDQVLHMVRTAKLVGQSIIAYLQDKGYPEVALHFVKEPRTRLSLALQCGNIEVALEAAKSLDETDAWDQLAKAALNIGNHQIVEMCYQRTKNFDKLTFLYLVTGNIEKLCKMMKIAEIRKDASAQFQCAMLLGDVQERIRLLKASGQTTLAYLTAVNHDQVEEAEQLKAALEAAGMAVPERNPDAQYICPPLPVVEDMPNWPLLAGSKSVFETGGDGDVVAAEVGDEPLEAAGAWGDEDEDILLDTKAEGEVEGEGEEVMEDACDDGGWDVGDEDLELPEVLAPVSADIDGGAEEAAYFAAPSRGPAVALAKLRTVHDHITVGQFEVAFRLLNEQVGVVNFEPYSEVFVRMFASGRAMFGALPCLPPLPAHLHRNWKEASGPELLPVITDIDGGAEEAAYFAAPSRGPAVALAKLRTVHDHITVGQFEVAFRLLNEQVGVVNFEPYSEVFVRMFASGRAMFGALPCLPPLPAHLHRTGRRPVDLTVPVIKQRDEGDVRDIVLVVRVQ
ncbi:Coatomer subunit alpha [Papilio xuthus]|uniref:Coatomer subunit alpha n=1 Tax=Papilio xuthus TaxID=66420 RepID=A0A0N1PEU9_PAPXU|nr:Coatomer subunit alpha [Papilio xuthus]